jgi:magnesium chelatase subunit I
MTQSTTLGELRASGYPDRTVKQELRANLLDRLELGQELFPGILGFDDTVLPGLERGILAGHDLILLGERGQAKTRLVRAIVNLLDDSVPAITGCEVNDHPFRPICARCRIWSRPRVTPHRSAGSRRTSATARSSRPPTRPLPI